ncbi:MAG: Gfo/Idh/MocA family protein [Bryobacteraceae bacterium]
MKIGIIGLGFMGATHLGAFWKMDGVEVGAVCTENPAAFSGDLSKTGGNLGRQGGVYDFSAVAKYQRWEELVKDPALDAVDICLPTDLHEPVATAALAAGKHVLCEKPMALTVNDCARMIDEAEKAQRVLMIGQVLRFWPAYRYLQEFGKGKEYGALRSATFVRRCGVPNWSRWLPVVSRSGGALLDLLVHDIDQALLLCGMPERVAAKKLGDVDGVAATLIYPGGPEVRIQGGWFAAETPFSMSFQARAERAELELTPAGLVRNDAAGVRTTIETEGDGYDAEVSYFVECCKTGRPPALCPPRASAQAVKVALLLKESRETGEQIKCLD